MKLLKKMRTPKQLSVATIPKTFGHALYKILRMTVERLFQGFMTFQSRKGEVLAGSTTFFVFLTLSPVLLLVITMYGKVVGDVNEAYNHVMFAIKDSMPHLAPWIYTSIQKIIKAQLSKDSLNTFNIVLLLYSGAGLSNTLVFGMYNIANVEERGRWYTEVIRSIVSVFFITVLVVAAIAITFQSGAIIQLFKDVPVLSWVLGHGSKGILQVGLFGLLLSSYYQFITPQRIRFKDAAIGSFVTIVLIMTAKSFYGVYLHYMKDELVQSFGNFYTLTVAVIYVFFMVCAFFYGASIAFAPCAKRGKVVSGFSREQKKSKGHKLPLAG